MTALFKKLNLKDQAEIVVLNAPPSFEPELAALAGLRIRRRLAEVKVAHFCLAFVTKQNVTERQWPPTDSAGDSMIYRGKASGE